MAKVSSAHGVGEDSTGVKEDHLVDFDANGHGLLRKGGLEGSLAVGGSIVKPRESGYTLSSVVFAIFSLSLNP